MFAYITLYAGLLISRVVSTGREWNRGGAYWLALFVLFVFAGFRYDVGCDWPNYYGHWLAFEGQGLGDAIQQAEPGHWVSIVLLQDLGLSYTYLGVFAAAVFFAGINHLARRERDPLAFIVLSFPVLVINIAMSAIRQAEAIGLICFAYGAFIDRKVFKFVAFVLLAYLFHRSALVMLFLTPFIFGTFSRRNLLLAAVLAAPGVYFLSQSDAAEVALGRYYDTGVDAAGAAFRIAVLVISSGAYLLLASKRWRATFPKDHDFVTMGAWLMLGSIALYQISSVIGDRFAYYLIPIQLMMFARAPYLEFHRNRTLMVIAPYIMLTTVLVVWVLVSQHFKYCYSPYQFKF